MDHPKFLGVLIDSGNMFNTYNVSCATLVPAQ